MLSVKRTDLMKALNRLTGIVQRHHKAPAFTCVAIVADGNGTTRVFGTNLDLWLASTIDAHGEISCLVNHRQMTDLIRACPTDDLTIKEADNGRIEVASGKFSAIVEQCDTGSAGDIAAPEFKTATRCNLDVAALARAALFSGKEETRYYLNGIHVGRDESAVTISSTDGHRLFRVAASSNHKGKINAIIPTAGIRHIVRLAKADAQATIEFAKTKNCRFRTDDAELIVRLIDGTFPDVTRVIPTGEVDGLIRVDIQDLAAAASRVSIGGKNPGVKLTGNGSSLAVSHDGLDFIGKDEIEAETSGEPIVVGFNAQYIADFAKVVKGRVEIQMRGGRESPFIFNPEQSDDLLILMQMRV